MKKALFLLIPLFLIVLASCDNFMNGSNVQEQLTQMIDVANATSCTLIVSNDTTMGSFLSTGDKSCKLGYSIDVQYTVKKDLYIFKGLKAVNQFHTEISLNDYVEFTTIDSDDQRGVYKVSIKLVKESNDILIIPDCTPVPAVNKEECKPEFKETGVEQDTTVTFVFNKAINITEYFTPTITDTSGVSLADYFDVPYLSDDKKTMYIPTNKDTKLIDPDGDIETKDIIVKIDLTDILDDEGNKGIGVFQHKYRINKTRDTIKPVLTTTQLYSSSGNALSDKAFVNWSGEGANNGDFGTNHTNGAVHIEIDGYDNESGVSRIIVEEKLIKYTDESSATSSAITTTLKCYKNEETGLLAANYEINDLSDGVFELKFSLKDNADNVSEKTQTFYIIKDTIIDSGRIKFAQEISQLGTSTEEWLKAVPIVTGDTQEVVLTLSPSTKDVFYGNYATDFEINAYWGYSENSIVEPITRTDNKFTFTRDVTKMAFIKLVCKDAIGNEREVIKRMAPRIEIFESSERENCYGLVNLKLYLMQCNIIAGGQIDLHNYAKFIYQLNYNPVANNDYIEVIPNITSVSNTEFEMNDEISSLNSFLAQQPLTAGTIGKLYLAATIGDFLSPRSSNFVQFEINDAAPDGTWAVLGEHSLSSGEDEAEYETVKDFGPEERPYIKDGFKIETEGIKNSGTQKIVISDYMTQAGKNAGIEYSFYIVNFSIDEHGSVQDTPDSPEQPCESHEAPVFKFETGNAVNSKIPEIFLNSSQSYMIYITAYDRTNKIKYIPFEFKTEYLHDEGDGEGNGKITIPFSTEEGGHLPESCSFYVNSGTTLTTSLNLTGDYAAPYLTHDSNPFSNPVYFEIGVPTDNATGNYGQENNYNPDDEPAPITLYKNAEGKYVLSYYIIPNVSNNIRLTPTYTINELRTQYKSYEKIIEYEPELAPVLGDPFFGNKIQIPYGNLREGLYTISFIVEDIYGNAAVYTYPFINSTLGYCLPYTKEYKVYEAVDESNVTQRDYGWVFTLGNSECDYIKLLTISGEQVSTINAEIRTAEYNSNGSESDTPEWKWQTWGEDLCSENTIEFGPHGWDGDPTRYPNLTTRVQASYPNEEIHNKWGKITGYYGCVDSDSTIGKGFFYTEYVFLAEDDVCNVKNCMEGINGMQIFFDNNVMVHTMYSPNQLTTSKYDKDAYHIWETKGLETGLEVYPTSRIAVVNYNDPTLIPGTAYYNPDAQPVATIDESAFKTRTYGNDKYDEIPSGYWYTTIVHFADGTVVMSDIKQKQ